MVQEIKIVWKNNLKRNKNTNLCTTDVNAIELQKETKDFCGL